MRKINWCKETTKGIEKIEPNENLTQIYLEKANNALRAAIDLKNNKEWEIPSRYYAMYFSIYAILMKIGIKCEIHACTIEFMKIYLKEYFSNKEINLLKEAQKARIDIQYYANREISEETYIQMKNNTAKFIIKCKEITFELNERKIKEIREKI